MTIIDSLNAIVGTGVAQWKTLKQAYTLWETAFNAQVFQLECGEITTGINNLSVSSNLSIIPNLVTTYAEIQNYLNLKLNFKLRNILGVQVFEKNLKTNFVSNEEISLPVLTFIH